MDFDLDSVFPASSDSSLTFSSTCLLDGEGGSSIPLKSRDVLAHVYADARFSAVEERLRFIPDKDAQVTFKFPLPHRAVVHRFEATMGSRELRTEVKPAVAAEAEFHEAVQQGHSAAKVKQEPEGSIYTIDLGNLTAHEPCVVRIHYLCLLECFAGTLEWVHTSTWVPPYISPKLDAASAEQAAKAVPSFAREVTYTLSYEVHIYSSTSICSVTSAEAINVAEWEPGSSCQRVVSLTSDVADPARDFRLLVELAQPEHLPLCTLTLQRCQRNAHTKTVGIASLCLPRSTPALQQKEQQQQGQPSAPEAKQEHSTAAAADTQQRAPHKALAPEGSQGFGDGIKSLFAPKPKKGPKKELVLVVDCSGSMSGSPIEFAKDAALYFVRDLPVDMGVKFQIVLFGSSHKTMSTTSVDYNAREEQHAVDWVNTNVKANLGGTEIYQTMKAVYDTPIPEGFERQVVFLTDGGASRQMVIEELLREHKQAAKTTVQTLGIGHGVHRHLVDAIASATGGLSRYVLSAQDIVPTCSFLKKCALSEDVLLQPRLKPKLCMLRSVPAVLPPRLFAGEPLLVLTEIVKAEEGAALELSAVRITGEEVCVTVPIPAASEDLSSVAARAKAGTKVAHLEGDAIATLHAMAYIKCLLSGRSALHTGPDGTRPKKDNTQAAVQDQVIKLATEEGLVTPYTSAIGVLLQADPKDPSKTQQMEVPLKLPQGRTLWAAGHPPDDSPEDVMHIMTNMSAPMSSFQGQGALRSTRSWKPSIPIRSCAPASIAPRSCAPAGPMVYRGFEAETAASMQRPRGLSVGFSQQKAKKSFSILGATKEDGLGDAEYRARVQASEEEEKMKEKELREVMAPVGSASSSSGDASALRSAYKRGGAQHAMPESAPPPAPRFLHKPSTPAEMLKRLNLSRTIQGFWETNASLLEDLQAQRSAKEGGKEIKEFVEQVQAAKPALLSPDVWTTVLVLAYLRQRLPQERPQWQGMETKALSWLQAHWPKGQDVQSVGACVLSAMKLV